MEKDVESGLQQSEAEGDDQVSGAVNDERPSPAEAALDERIAEQIQQEVERRFQSAKDKRWAQLEKQYGRLSEVQQGGSRNDSDEGLTQQLLTKVRKILEKAGLEEDPEIVALMQQRLTRQDVQGALDLLGDVTGIALRKVRKAPASAATVIQPGDGKAPAQDLRQAYEVRKRRLRPGDVNGLMALKREFRKRGLEIY
jgi:hypothetical protein